MGINRDPAIGWPNGPLTKPQARELLEEDAILVWVMDHEENSRDLAFEADISTDSVLDVVLETDDRFEMYERVIERVT